MSEDRSKAGEKPGAETRRIEKDAKGQFAGTQAGGDSDGVVSAKPQVVTGSEDATIHYLPPGHERKHPGSSRRDDD